MTLELILTWDYELFGDGSGDVFSHMVDPTRRLLELCNRSGIKITVFFEVMEYLKIKEQWEKGETMGYRENPGAAIEDQIRRILSDGHDVQLHLHPQWVNAEYRNGWQVDMDSWHPAGLAEVSGNPADNTAGSVLERGKTTLENLLRPVDRGYRCRGLRMGGFNIQPSAPILRAMRQCGLVLDSSVFPGGFSDTPLARHDFRTIRNTEPFWFVPGDDVLETASRLSKDTIIECPVFALTRRRLFKYGIQRLRVKWKNREYAVRQFRRRLDGGVSASLHYLFRREAVQWDFCLLGRRQLQKYFREATRIKKNSRRRYHPFLLIGHSKDFCYSSAFRSFVGFCAGRKVRFATLSDVLDRIVEKRVVDG